MSTIEPTAPAVPQVSLAAIAWGFTRVVMFSFGGGLSAWSQLVVVEQRRWLTEEEFLSALTVCRVVPGPVQFNMAVYVGAKLRGFPGALAALVGLLTLPVLIVLILAVLYAEYQDVSAVRLALRGMVSASVGLTLAMGIRLAEKYRHRFSAVVFILAAFVPVALLHWRLLHVIAVLGPLAVLWNWPRNKAKEPTTP